MLDHAAAAIFTYPSAKRDEQLLSSRALSDLEAPSDRILPIEFPIQLNGPQVWSGRGSKSPLSSVITISEEEMGHLEEALHHYKGLSITRDMISRTTFPLPAELSAKFKSLSHTVHEGLGFVILRGLDPTKYTEEENVLLYGGISSHVAEERADMIYIYDRAMGDRSDQSMAKFPPNEIAIPMDFHTDVDAGDILSLFTLNLSKSGGRQFLTSFWNVYNILARDHPDVLATLATDWRFEMAAGISTNVIYRPVVFNMAGKVQINFGSAFLQGSSYLPRLPEGLFITEAQQHAMVVLLEICKQHCVALDQVRGDMLFVNNLSILHAREEFADEPSTGKSRHLLSMMLHDPDLARPKPATVVKYIDERFTKLQGAKFFGTVGEWEAFRKIFAMLRHD